MAILASPRYRRIYLDAQTGGFGTVNNSSGTWTNTNAVYLPAMENAVRLTPNMPRTPVPILTGTRSYRSSILGRKTALWELNNIPIIPSGAAGTAPQTDLLWQNIFGQAGTVVASTSVAYSFLDSGFIPLTIFDFMHGVSTLMQRLAWGCFCTEFTITFNGNIFEGSFRGFGGYRLDSTNFTNEDTTSKAGLTTYPVEPVASVSVLGSVIPGFYATATFDSQDVSAKVRSLQIRGTTGYRMIADVVSSAYGVAVVGGPRQISCTLGLVLDDSSQITDLEQKAKQNSTITASVLIGQTAGAKVQFDLQGLQLVPADQVDETSDIVMNNFPESPAHASAVGSTDDLVVTFK